MEFGLVIAGAYLYYRSAIRLPTSANANKSGQRQRVLTASGVTATLLLLLLVSDLLGL
jgi:hypothetical protein